MMNRYVLLMLIVLLGACTAEDPALDINPDVPDKNESNREAFFSNWPLPLDSPTLRILAIGNSYTVDATEQLGNIVREAGIGDDRYCVYRLNHNAARLKYYAEHLTSGELIDVEHPCGDIDMELTKATLPEIISRPWDVIVLQQYSGDAVDYTTYNPYLRELITAITTSCSNPRACLAWHMIWSYRDGFLSKEACGEQRWHLLSAATIMQMWNDGIDVIIPTGTAIQNARNTALQNDAQLTRDGTHLDPGIGRYIAACTFFESIFAPVFGCTVMGNTALYTPSMSEMTQFKYPATEVTNQNAPLCQQCAKWAVEDMFTLRK